MNVRQSFEERHVCRDLAYQSECAIGTRNSEMPNEIEIDPIGNQAKKADHRARQPFHFVWNNSARIARSTKVIDIDSVSYKERVLVVRSFCFVQPVGRNDHA